MFVSQNKTEMKGVIYHTNVERAMYSVQLPNGSFVVFELVDQRQLDMYTEVSGELERCGESEIVMNQDDKLHIHIDEYGLSEMVAFKKTFLND